MSKEIIDIGDMVCCDFCNYGDESMGGVLIGSHAICGDCCDKYGYDKPDYEHAHEVDRIFPKDKTFKENVLNLRQETTGQTSGIIEIVSGEDFFKAMGLK